MASKKQKGTVFHQEVAMAPAPDGPSPHFLTQTSKGGHAVTKADMKVATRTPDELPAAKRPTCSNLPPDSVCKGITVTLENNNMWNEFFRCRTEMILTKQGSRMFPYCRFRISGLNPSRKYSLVMDIQPSDGSHYRWTGKSWQVAGKAESHIKNQPFAHPESPSTGQHWMQNPVSFYKLKLTNNILDQDGNAILYPMHPYLPRLHVIQTDKAAKDINLNSPSVVTFTFPQTEFMAVLAYQNPRFTQLKVDYNPFAKGLKEDGASFSLGLKAKLKPGKDVHKDGGTTSMEQGPVKKSLKTLLANHKPRSSKALDAKPLHFGDPPKGSPANKDQTKVPMERVCAISHPAQKLFSELIREAHVSLQRCNVEQLSISNSSSPRTEPTNTSMSAQTPRVKNRQEDKHHVDSSSGEAHMKTSCPDVTALVQNSPVDSGLKCKPDVVSEVVLKQHKRPAPLPLPALALFLKQHSTKTKKPKCKQDSSTSCPSSESVSACLPVGQISSGPSAESRSPVTEYTGSTGHPKEVALNDIGQVVATALKPLGLSCVNAVVTTDGIRTESPVHAERTLVLATSGSTPSTFPLDTDLPVLKPTLTESCMLPAAEAKMKSLLSDPECSSVGFEPLSPASSPEPLPSLPASLGLELDNSASGSCVNIPSNPEQSRNSATSVFKWHTVLPPAEPYLDTSFPPFQPTPQPLPLASSPSPFMNSQTALHSEPQPLHTSSPPTAPTFQENEQSLPFPAELSPLALQLPLSPTFSSLDGDGLSPTPSLADLVHFFSTDDDLGMGVEFSNAEAVAPSCSPPSTIEATAQEISQPVQPIPANKTFKRKKSSRRQKLGKTVGQMDEQIDASVYTKMQPNLEEVEEQLFISFTSKEALRLHVADSEEAVTQTTPEAHLQPAVDTLHSDTAEIPEKTTLALEQILLRDLKLMKHRQVIHPVLQEVGLKMNLLDPTLAIDLQYLGVRLPIPPPGVSLEMPPPQAFISRTGKTTDVTQIKGWREKFSPSEVPSIATSAKPEAGPSSDLTKKNLSAFCSDMLDEYLEHEGKLIDERAASFSQPQVEPVVYELPTRSTSYVRTLDSVLKKQPCRSPTSDLISGFIPPSQRPRRSLKEKTTSRKGEQKLKSAKQNKLKVNPEPTPEQTLSVVQTLGLVPPSDHTEPHKSKKKPLKVQFNHTEPVTLSSKEAAFKKSRKPKPSSQTLSPLTSKVVSSTDMAPLESDSEVGATDEASEPCRKRSRTMITQALLRQKALEDSVVWEGRPRTSVTKERATVALTSLFTQKGFVTENPTAPVQLPCRPGPPCLNEFCRLGCICSSLSHCSNTSHCGRPQCMFGCSCLKQKVVLLKNLDSFDCSSSQHQNKKKRRRMKMAYILKEADSVSQPAKRIQTLWKKDCGSSDPDPVHVPELISQPHLSETPENNSSCARARGFTGRRTKQKRKEATKVGKSKVVRLKSLKNRDLTLKEPKTKAFARPPADQASCEQVPIPPPEPPPKPLKRLIILAESKWESDSDRKQVLKALCESMAHDRLRDPFWIKKYLISPLTKTVSENGTGCCIQYRIHISTPKVEPEKPPEPQQGTTRPQQKQEGGLNTQQDAEVDPMEVGQQRVTEGDKEELVEDWQREVEEDDVVEHEDSSLPHMDNEKEMSKDKTRTKETQMNSLGLPFLTSISPAGFLSASRKVPGRTEQLVQVNGKLYPLAKIQLGKMGALHPANRLAAYLTGRVGSNKEKQVSSSVPPQTSGPSSQTSTVPRPQISPVIGPSSSTGLQANRSAAPESPQGAGISLHQRPAGQANHLQHSTAPSASQVNMPVVQPVKPFIGLASSKASQVLMVEVLRSPGKVLVSSPNTPPTSQRMALKPVLTASGVRFYRKPDGKLVRLVPVSQLRSAIPNPLLQKDPHPPSVLPAASLPTPIITVVKQAAAVGSSSSTASLSGLRSSSVSLPSSLPLPTGSQKGVCTFKILPTGSNREPIIITCPKVPLQPRPKVVPVPGSAPVTPVKLVSPGGGTGIRVKVAAPVASGGVLAETPTETTLTPTIPEAAPPPPPPPPASEPEMACGLVDLDIICVDDETMEVVNVGGLSSSETEDSSDFESDIEGDTERRLLHNVLERKRRVQMKQLFEGLKDELGLDHEKTSKISILKKAAQVIEELRTTHRRLKMKKKRLMDRRQKYLIKVQRNQNMCRDQHFLESVVKQRTREKQADVEVVDLLDTDEPTDNSSDEEVVVIKTPDIMANDKEDEVQCVASWEGYSQLSSESSLMKTPEAPSDTKASRAQSSVLDTNRSALEREKACEELLPQSETRNSMNQQRDTDVTKPSQGPGESELMGLEKRDGHREPDVAAYAGGGDSKPPPLRNETVNNSATKASDQQQAPQTAPTPVSIITPHMVLHLSNSVLTRPAPKLRTMPNILSRKKNSGPVVSVVTNSVEGKAPSFQPLVPTNVLSLVAPALPGQPVLSLRPLIAGRAVLQTTPPPGMVTLNLPSLTNQQTHLASLPRPPAATNVTNLLQLVQPQTLQLPPPQVQHPPPLSLVVSTGSDSVKDQDQPQTHLVCRPESSPSSSSLSHSIQTLSSSLGSGLSKELEVVEGGAVSPGQQQQTRRGAEAEGLTSLLNEINFLNQQTVCVSSQVRQSSKVNDHPHCSWIPQLDSSSEDADAMELQQAGITGDQRTNSLKNGVLAPPPLLQMSMGGAKIAEPSAGKGPTEPGCTEGGVTWRPMPRLVPLGLRGNQLS